MKRDLDLCRQLMFDLETAGANCAANLLRRGLVNDTDARVRFHLRLLMDADLVKEVERTAAGATCLRLTHTGVEFLEVCRSDARWREAKKVVHDRTGGQSLTAIRALLTKWAVESSSYGYSRLPRRSYHPYYRQDEAVRYRREPVLLEPDDELRLVRTMPDYRETFEWNDRHHHDHRGCNCDSCRDYSRVDEAPKPSVQLPIYLV